MDTPRRGEHPLTHPPVSADDLVDLPTHRRMQPSLPEISEPRSVPRG
ncbi:hypothetical protein [Streptomyces sp. NPDC048057]